MVDEAGPQEQPTAARHNPAFAAEFGALATEFCLLRRCLAHHPHMVFGKLARLPAARPPAVIHAFMVVQADLVEVLGQFDPKLVKMCPASDHAED